MNKIKIELLTKLLKMDDEVTFNEHNLMFQIERYKKDYYINVYEFVGVDEAYPFEERYKHVGGGRSSGEAKEAITHLVPGYQDDEWVISGYLKRKGGK